MLLMIFVILVVLKIAGITISWMVVFSPIIVGSLIALLLTISQALSVRIY